MNVKPSRNPNKSEKSEKPKIYCFLVLKLDIGAGEVVWFDIFLHPSEVLI